jgi:large-conductance mechanosensitive channel
MASTKVIKIIENNIIKLESKAFNLLILTLEFLKLNLAGFIKFLFDKNIIQTSIGIIIASQIGKLTNLFVDTILNPIINKLTSGAFKKNEDWVVTFFDIELKIGLIISNLINFILVIFIIYNIWKLSNYTDFSFITNFLEETKGNISKIIPTPNIVISAPELNTYEN